MPPSPHHPPLHRARSRGFTLVEIMVALLVLSLGVLGAAGMQVAAIQANRDARNQEAAVRLASELGELIRANNTTARATTVAANPYLQSFSGSALTAGTSCYINVRCINGVEVANRDMVEWSQRVVDLLPGARVTVCFDETPYAAAGQAQWACTNTGTVMQIKIGWSRPSLDRSTIDQATRPSVVVPVPPVQVL